MLGIVERTSHIAWLLSSPVGVRSTRRPYRGCSQYSLIMLSRILDTLKLEMILPKAVN